MKENGFVILKNKIQFIHLPIQAQSLFIYTVKKYGRLSQLQVNTEQ